MTKKEDIIYMIRHIRTKHRLSIRKRDTDKEIWYTYTSANKMLSSFIIFLSASFIITVATVIYTPILDLLPGYPGRKSRELLISNIMKIDSMEHSMKMVSSYVDNKSRIINGRIPHTADDNTTINTTYKEIFKPVPTSVEDSILRAQIDSIGIYMLPKTKRKRKVLLDGTNLLSPVNGLVITEFNPSQEIYGVEIATAENKPIMAVNDGSIVFATWTPDQGNIIQIQHQGDLISTYKNITNILHSVGDIVKGGEVIGYTGEGISGEGNKDLINFELWHNGVAVDPEQHVWF